MDMKIPEGFDDLSVEDRIIAIRIMVIKHGWDTTYSKDKIRDFIRAHHKEVLDVMEVLPKGHELPITHPELWNTYHD